MGPSQNLARFFLFGLVPFPREIILEGKIKAKNEEDKLMMKGSRLVNIDFGILSLENVILATYKPFSHRIYLTEGIYQELTYFYQNKTYKTLPWTYPDYADEETLNFFNLVREILSNQIRQITSHALID
jgi:hypothetical protein